MRLKVNGGPWDEMGRGWKERNVSENSEGAKKKTEKIEIHLS